MPAELLVLLFQNSCLAFRCPSTRKYLKVFGFVNAFRSKTESLFDGGKYKAPKVILELNFVLRVMLSIVEVFCGISFIRMELWVARRTSLPIPGVLSDL